MLYVTELDYRDRTGLSDYAVGLVPLHGLSSSFDPVA